MSLYYQIRYSLFRISKILLLLGKIIKSGIIIYKKCTVVVKCATKFSKLSEVSRMANHEFGIMKNTPKDTEVYDEYEPRKYELIGINDDFIEPLLPKFEAIYCYWHTLQQPGMNLAYTGITLIPPESINDFLSVFKNSYNDEYKMIISMLEEAKINNKYIIHFGI